MNVQSLWLTSMTIGPLGVLVAARLDVKTERLRTGAIVGASMLLVTCAMVLVLPELASMRLAWPGTVFPILGGYALQVDSFSAPLIPLPAALWLITVAATPRARLDRAGLGRTALAALFTTLAFLTRSPAILVLLWTISNLIFLRALSSPEHRRPRRVASVYLWTSAGLLFTGIIFITTARGGSVESLGLWLIVIAVLIRKGIFPFHAWIPALFDKARVGPTLLFSAPQMGAYVAVVLVLPRASADMLKFITVLSLVTAVYGAVLSLVQRDARRACGYLFVSQSALVLAGLDGTNVEALAGSLVLWVSSALAFTGMARTVLVLEARRGRLDLSKYHGGYEQMPLLAVSFLVLGMACTGFPGTLGFVGEEMLLEGAVHGYPLLGFSVVATSALTGLGVLRMYFSFFCGTRSNGFHLKLLRREGIVFGAVATVLVINGLLPQFFVESRLDAGRSLLQTRAAWGEAVPAHTSNSEAVIRVNAEVGGQ